MRYINPRCLLTLLTYILLNIAANENLRLKIPGAIKSSEFRSGQYLSLKQCGLCRECRWCYANARPRRQFVIISRSHWVAGMTGCVDNSVALLRCSVRHHNSSKSGITSCFGGSRRLCVQIVSYPPNFISAVRFVYVFLKIIFLWSFLYIFRIVIAVDSSVAVSLCKPRVTCDN